MQSGSQLAAAHSSVISWEAARVTIHKGISAWLCVRVRKEKVKVSKRQIVDAIIRWWLIAKIAGKKVRKLFWLKSASNHAGLADQCRTVTNTIAMNSLSRTEELQDLNSCLNFSLTERAREHLP